MTDARRIRLRVVTKGTAFETDFFDAETGEKLSLPISAMRLECVGPDGMWHAHVTLECPEIDATICVTEADQKMTRELRELASTDPAKESDA